MLCAQSTVVANSKQAGNSNVQRLVKYVSKNDGANASHLIYHAGFCMAILTCGHSITNGARSQVLSKLSHLNACCPSCIYQSMHIREQCTFCLRWVGGVLLLLCCALRHTAHSCLHLHAPGERIHCWDLTYHLRVHQLCRMAASANISLEYQSNRAASQQCPSLLCPPVHQVPFCSRRLSSRGLHGVEHLLSDGMLSLQICCSTDDAHWSLFCKSRRC